MKPIKTLTLNGNTYEIADGQTREAVSALGTALLKKNDPCVLTKDSVFHQGYLDGGEFVAVDGTNTQRTSDFIQLEPGVIYQCDFAGENTAGTALTAVRTICFYNADQTFTRAPSMPAGMSNIKLEGDEKYIRINYNAAQVTVLRVYPKAEGYETKIALNEKLEVPQIELEIGRSGGIREEVKTLESTLLEKDDPCVLTKDSAFYPGYINGSEFVETDEASNFRTSDYIALQPGVYYKCDYEGVKSDGTVTTYPRAIVTYKADKSYSRNLSLPSGLSIYLQDDEKYIRVNYSDPQVNLLRVYPRDRGYEIKITLNPALEVPQAEKIKGNSTNYIHARRPVIAFIFDGEYDRNADMEAKFSEHNMRAGFAPQYTTNFENNSAETYRAWQKKGHEILAHGTYVLHGGLYTDEQAKEYIKASYERLTSSGFDIHGYIGCSGAVDEKYLPIIQQYFDYAATTSNHNTQSAESCIFFGTDHPYKLWRYSLQDATPDQIKVAIDRAMSQCGLLLLYGHARSDQSNNLTVANMETILSYIEEVGASVKTPYEAIREYYAIRYEDMMGR